MRAHTGGADERLSQRTASPTSGRRNRRCARKGLARGLTFESCRRFSVGGVSTYRISELARQAGVPASTLRFYEQAGLLPAERTGSGYRVYGEDAVARLEFIGSAKHLGLPLEEIRELLGAWEQGVCAEVRTRLRPLVAARIAEAERRIAELSAFAAHLASVHEDLSGPAPVSACGPGCGCVSAEPRGPVPVQVELTRPRTADAGVPGGAR